MASTARTPERSTKSWLARASTAFWSSIRDVRPDLYKGFNPWDRISEPEAVEGLLRQTDFRAGDMLALRLPEAPFDAVVCVFGVFFVPDMAAAVRALWRAVSAGGRGHATTRAAA